MLLSDRMSEVSFFIWASSLDRPAGKTVIDSGACMARLQSTRSDAGSTSGQRGSSSKRFTQRVRVVENGSGSSTAQAGSLRRRSSQREDDEATEQHFARNSEAIEQRATADLKETLVWVARLSETPVHRTVLRAAVSGDLPRWAAGSEEASAADLHTRMIACRPAQ